MWALSQKMKHGTQAAHLFTVKLENCSKLTTKLSFTFTLHQKIKTKAQNECHSGKSNI